MTSPANVPANRFNPHVYPGQRVVTAGGNVATVAFLSPDGQAFVYGPRGVPTSARVAFDALGGEAALDPGATPRVSTFTGPPPSGPQRRRPVRGLRRAA